MTRLTLLSLALFTAVSGCTVAGDIVSPPRERKAHCKASDATPLTQTGLYAPGVTTDPAMSTKGKRA